MVSGAGIIVGLFRTIHLLGILNDPLEEKVRAYIARRIFGMLPTLALISIIIFVVIQLPPGDIVTSTLDRLQAEGVEVSNDQIQNLRAQYNLDQPMVFQYLHWIGGFVVGDMGYSYLYSRPVNELVWERLGYTLLITVSALIFTWAIAIPAGIYSAVRQYSIGDYLLCLLYTSPSPRDS